MNILAISSLLPIPGFTKTNDFVLKIYSHYKKMYKGDSIVIIKPVKYNLKPITLFRKSNSLSKIRKCKSLQISDFQVEIYPYLSFWRLRNVHSLITRSIYFLNKKRLDDLFEQIDFDIIHAQYIFPDGLLARLLGKKYNIPYVITTHNERYYFRHLIARNIASNILRNASKMIPINHTNYLFFKTLNLSNTELTPLGFSKDFLRKQNNNIQTKTRIITVAELIKLKNIDKVLLALGKLASKYDVFYTIVGNGPEKSKLIKLTESLNLTKRVTFIGYIPHDHIADEMYKHDIFVMPSYFETFGRVYFEAMAMGIPVICAKNSGIYGIFKNMEEGIAVSHDNVDEIADAMEFLISDPGERLRIGRNGKKLVEQYTWDNVAADLHRKYETAILRKL